DLSIVGELARYAITLCCTIALFQARAHDSESIVGILKCRWDAGSRRATGGLDVMAPRAAAGCSPVAGDRSCRVALRRIGVVVFAKPIRAPFVDVLAQIENAERVRQLLSDWPRTFDFAAPSAKVVRPRQWWLVAPRIQRVVAAA